MRTNISPSAGTSSSAHDPAEARAALSNPPRLFRHNPAWEPMKPPPTFISWLQVGPTTLILLFFFVLPMLVVIAVSFFDYENAQIVETFIVNNYHDVFTSSVTLQQYAKSLKFAAIVWALTLIIGFNVSYFLVFHV